MVRPAGLILAVFLALFFLLPAPGLLAAEQSVSAPAAKAAAKTVLDPDMDEGHRQFAYANYEKALEHYLKALERDKEDAYLYFRIGMAYYMLGDDDIAHQYWETTYDIDNRLSDNYIYENTGDCLPQTLLEGDIFYVDEKYYNYLNVNRDDIILYRIQSIPNKLILGRVVGLENDTIEIVDRKIFLNNMEVGGINDEQRLNFLNEIKNKKINKSSIFVLCDNKKLNLNDDGLLLINKKLIFGKLLVVLDSKESSKDKTTRRDDRLGMIIK
jgi:signal peptidase I